jgi:outer membrane receptor protein involved in Fe transport
LWAGLVTLGLVIFAADLPAQDGPGVISGSVHDEQTSDPLALVQVHIPSLGIGTLTNLDGRFMLRNVPAGSYEVVVEILGYAQKTITDVVVEPGKIASLDVTLPPEAITLEAITVSVERERGNASRLLDTRRTSDAVEDAVGAQDIARSPDSDAADVAKRVTGVTVNQGKYVYVRGLGERYSQTQLNGSPLPSPEPEKETVPLDLFPAQFLESFTAQKTYTPDLEADFSGGTVKIQTKEFFDRPFLRLGVAFGATSNSQLGGANFLRYDGGGSDFLGVDDGSRALPAEVEGGISGPQLPADPEVRQEIGRAMSREFTPFSDAPPINFGLGLAAGTRASLFGNELGLLFGLKYKQNWVVRVDEVERKWRTDAFDPEIPEDRRSPNVDYTFDRGIRAVTIGGLFNLNYKLGASHKIGLQTMFTRVADDEARTFFGANREDIGGEVSNNRLRFVSRQMLWGQLAGEHRLFWDSRFEWRAALARATRDEPGLRESLYLRSFADPDTAPMYLEPRGESGRYFYSDLADDDFNSALSWKVPFNVWSSLPASLKLGAQLRSRDRDFKARRFNWQFLGGVTENIDQALTDSTILGQLDGPGTFVIDEIGEPGDQYQVEDRRRAVYAMLELPLTGWLRTIVGARYEAYRLTLTSRGEVQTDISEQGGGYVKDVLPSVNLIWSLSDRMNVRAAYSRTLDRPEFRELAPFQFTEATSLRQIIGNPELGVARIWNADLRWDWFTRPGEVLSVSAFYKHFDDPIEQVFLAAASAAYSFQNARDGRLYGVEFEIRQRLDRLADRLRTFTFLGNLMLSNSEVSVIERGAFIPTNTRRPLEGQSPWVLNLGLLYTHPHAATEVGFYYNIAGDRVAAAGGSGVPDIYERSRSQLDLSITQNLFGGTRVKFQGKNLLNSAYRFEQSQNGITLLQREYKTGASYDLSLSFEL